MFNKIAAFDSLTTLGTWHQPLRAVVLLMIFQLFKFQLFCATLTRHHSCKTLPLMLMQNSSFHFMARERANNQSIWAMVFCMFIQIASSDCSPTITTSNQTLRTVVFEVFVHLFPLELASTPYTTHGSGIALVFLVVEEITCLHILHTF